MREKQINKQIWFREQTNLKMTIEWSFLALAWVRSSCWDSDTLRYAKCNNQQQTRNRNKKLMKAEMSALALWDLTHFSLVWKLQDWTKWRWEKMTTKNSIKTISLNFLTSLEARSMISGVMRKSNSRESEELWMSKWKISMRNTLKWWNRELFRRIGSLRQLPRRHSSWSMDWRSNKPIYSTRLTARWLMIQWRSSLS